MRPSGGVGWIRLGVKWFRLRVKQYGAGEAAGAIRAHITRYPRFRLPVLSGSGGREFGQVGFVALRGNCPS
jgi:hypothetical protein